MKRSIILAAALLCAPVLVQAMSHTDPEFVDRYGRNVITMQPRKGHCGTLKLAPTQEAMDILNQNAGLATLVIEAFHVQNDGSQIEKKGEREVTGPYATRFGDGGHDRIDVYCSVKVNGTIAEAEAFKRLGLSGINVNSGGQGQGVKRPVDCNKVFTLPYGSSAKSCGGPFQPEEHFDNNFNLKT